MSRIPAVAEFEIGTTLRPDEAQRPGVITMLAAALSRLFREMALRSARRRLDRFAAADPRFMKDIGMAPGEAESLIRHGRRRGR